MSPQTGKRLQVEFLGPKIKVSMLNKTFIFFLPPKAQVLLLKTESAVVLDENYLSQLSADKRLDILIKCSSTCSCSHNCFTIPQRCEGWMDVEWEDGTYCELNVLSSINRIEMDHKNEWKSDSFIRRSWLNLIIEEEALRG